MPKIARAGMVIDQEYMVVPIDSIQPHPSNPNHGDVGVIEESIKYNDWYGACIVQRSTRRILAGEHRWRAAKARGATKIPILLRDVDDAKALRIMLVDNESARHAEIDEEVRDQILQSLAEIDDGLLGSGFDLSILEEGADDEDEEPAEDDPESDLFDPDDLGPEPGSMWGVIVVVESEEAQVELFEQMVQDFGSKNVRVVGV